MKRWLYRLHIFCRLPSEDRANLVMAWLLLLSLPGLCRLVGVRACLRWMQRMVGRQPLPASSAPCLADWVDHQGVLGHLGGPVLSPVANLPHSRACAVVPAGATGHHM